MKNKTSLFGLLLFCMIGRVDALQVPVSRRAANSSINNMQQVLPGTKALTWEGDLSTKMLDSAHKFIEEKIDESIDTRAKLWNRDLTSRDAYEKSVEPNRRRFMKCIGVENKSDPFMNYNV